ncbi:MAG: hypothetical protein HYR88_06825 [Verrucomicrobia bacterium]|nr:hypothetical protein [Verrucomicrobiota bacterium]
MTFDSNNLDDTGGDPHYGVEVYFNGVLIQPEITVRPADLDFDYSTPEFSLADVNAQLGRGFDNIVSLKGINHSGDGGGNWMGIDYIQINPVLRFLPPVVVDGKLKLDWIGSGGLESAPTVVGPWTPVAAAANPPYSEAILPGQNRFFRLTRQ